MKNPLKQVKKLARGFSRGSREGSQGDAAPASETTTTTTTSPSDQNSGHATEDPAAAAPPGTPTSPRSLNPFGDRGPPAQQDDHHPHDSIEISPAGKVEVHPPKGATTQNGTTNNSTPGGNDNNNNNDDDNNDDADLDDLDGMLEDLDIDKDFQCWSSFRSSMSRRSTIKETSSKGAESSDMLAPISEAMSPEEARLEKEDIDKWNKRLQREEVFSHRYRPTRAEKKELQELENCLGMNSAQHYITNLLDNSGPKPLEETWKTLIHPDTKAGTPASIILKRHPILFKSSFDTEHREHEAELVLLTRGLVIARVVGGGDTHTNGHSQHDVSNVPRQLERAVEYKSVVCVLPENHASSDDDELAWDIVLRSERGQERLSFITGSVRQQAAWLEAMEIVVVNHFEHDPAFPKTDMGWQYRVVHKPAFTAAVMGVEDDMVFPKKLNCLDSYNGYAPLHYAVRLKHERIVESLLEEGADPNTPDEDGVTAIVHAVRDEVPESILQLLENYGGTGSERAKTEKAELFERVTATQNIRVERREKQQQKEAAAAQAKMAENMRLLKERGEKIDRAADGARELNDGARDYGDMARQLKEKTKRQASWNPFG